MIGALALAGIAAASAAASTGGTPAGTTVPGRVVVRSVRCVPAVRCTRNTRSVRPGGRLRISGHGLRVGMTVVFRAPARLGHHVTARLRRTRLGFVVTVPPTALSGHIHLIDLRGRATRSFGPIHVISPARVPTPVAAGPGDPSPFDGNGMWIWQLPKSDGGDLGAIVARAHANDVSTVFVKSSDGSSNWWAQFSPQLVSALKANGLKVCAWQYVYGTRPTDEANLGARAVATGADCLVIDAEKEYEGQYAAAQDYIAVLRQAVGPTYPIGLASFPYVDYHPALPYSVFLGPGGAQFDVPQMYWKAIGTTVDRVYAHTYDHNRIYQRPIFPLGQTYEDPSPSDFQRFRQLASAYGATGVSWWDWQETSDAEWAQVGGPVAPLQGFFPDQSWPVLARRSKGDEVVWLQEHLATYDATTPLSGVFDSNTDRVLRSLQASRGLPVTGSTDLATWQAVLSLAPVAVDWTTRRTATSASGRHAPPPRSARLPARRDEIPRVG